MRARVSIRFHSDPFGQFFVQLQSAGVQVELNNLSESLRFQLKFGKQLRSVDRELASGKAKQSRTQEVERSRERERKVSNISKQRSTFIEISILKEY